MTEFWRLPATEIAILVRTRQASATEVAKDALARLDAVNPAINAVIEHRPADVLAQAAAIDAAIARGEVRGQGGGEAERLARGGQAIHQADALRFLGLDRRGVEKDLPCAGQAYAGGQREGQAEICHQPDLVEPRHESRPRAGHDGVRRTGEREPRADAPALHRRDDGQPPADHEADQAMRAAHALAPLLGVAHIHARYVPARAEGAARTGDDDSAQAFIALGGFQRLEQLLAQRHGQRVAALGIVERQCQNRARALGQDPHAGRCSVAPVLACTSSAVTPGARSARRKPRPGTTSITARLV